VSAPFVIRIGDDAVELEQEEYGVYRLGFLDVEYAPSGVTAYLGNMNEDEPRQSWSGSIYINEKPVFVALDSGTCRPITQELRWSPPASLYPHMEYYLQGGPLLEDAPADFVRYRLGPRPDPEDNDATGSGRVFSQRNPMLMSLLLNQHRGDSAVADEEHVVEAQRWANDQAGRGCLFYSLSEPHRMEQFVARTSPGIGVGKGYRKAGGGFNDLYNNEIPKGFDFHDKTGLQVGSAAHFTVEGLMVCSAYFGSRAAARMAWAAWQSNMSFFYSTERWSSRSYGWIFGGAADLAVISRRFPDIVDVDELMANVEDVVKRLKSKNYMGMPCPDNGRTSEGGHLSYNELHPTLSKPPFNWTELKIQNAAKSDCLFFVGILMSGIDKLVSVWDALGVWGVIPMREHSVRKLLMDQYHVACKFIAEQCWTYSFDIRAPLSAAWSRSKSGLWMDVASEYRLAEGGGSHSDMVGVIIRFVVGAVYRASHTLYLPELTRVAAKTLEHCASQNYYGGNDRAGVFVESLWPLGVEKGWFLR
jgi:hypothetical protein